MENTNEGTVSAAPVVSIGAIHHDDSFTRPTDAYLPVGVYSKEGLVPVSFEISADDIAHGWSFRESESANPLALALIGKSSHHWCVTDCSIRCYHKSSDSDSFLSYWTPVSVWGWLIRHANQKAGSVDAATNPVQPFTIMLWMPESEAPNAN